LARELCGKVSGSGFQKGKQGRGAVGNGEAMPIPLLPLPLAGGGRRREPDVRNPEPGSLSRATRFYHENFINPSSK